MYVIYSAIMDEFSREGHNLHFVWISNHCWEYENMENEMIASPTYIHKLICKAER